MLAAERTALAWQRTALGFMAASAVALKVLSGAGWGPVAMAGAGFVFAVATLVMAARRYQQVHHGLHHDDSLRPSGAAVVAMGASVLALGAGCLWWIGVIGVQG